MSLFLVNNFLAYGADQNSIVNDPKSGLNFYDIDDYDLCNKNFIEPLIKKDINSKLIPRFIQVRAIAGMNYDEERYFSKKTKTVAAPWLNQEAYLENNKKISFKDTSSIDSNTTNAYYKNINHRVNTTGYSFSEASNFSEESLSTSRFQMPYGLNLIDRSLYVADTKAGLIKKIDLCTKKVENFAGLDPVVEQHLNKSYKDRESQYIDQIHYSQIQLDGPQLLSSDHTYLYFTQFNNSIFRLSLTDSILRTSELQNNEKAFFLKTWVGKKQVSSDYKVLKLNYISSILINKDMLYLVDSKNYSIYQLQLPFINSKNWVFNSYVKKNIISSLANENPYALSVQDDVLYISYPKTQTIEFLKLKNLSWIQKQNVKSNIYQTFMSSQNEINLLSPHNILKTKDYLVVLDQESDKADKYNFKLISYEGDVYHPDVVFIYNDKQKTILSKQQPLLKKNKELRFDIAAKSQKKLIHQPSIAQTEDGLKFVDGYKNLEFNQPGQMIFDEVRNVFYVSDKKTNQILEVQIMF